MVDRNIQTAHRPEGKRVVSGRHARNSRIFRNSFSDTETVDRPDAQYCRLDTHARDSEFELKNGM
jgi:hypothetical protein